MKKHVPNTITCLNLLSGCIGITLAFNNLITCACYAIVLAAAFDFFDGLAARVLKAYSAMGKELDSLADVVSFGVLPSVIVYQLFLQLPQTDFSVYINLFAFIITIASALRLANFNIDERQTENFIGLPVPANALLIASLPMILTNDDGLISGYILNPYFLIIFSIVSSVMLLMEVPLISLKFKNLAVNDNLYRYILLFSGIILILIFKFVAVPIILFLYILLSIIQFRIIK